MKLQLVVLAALAYVSEAALSRPTHVLHEKRGALHPSWKRHSRAPADMVMPLKFGLRQRNLESFEELLLDISDPRSANFGKHWTPKQVAETFAPAKETSELTIAWLVESGISRDRLRHSTGTRIKIVTQVLPD
jgi:tripeptidyl-peptidase I